MSFRAFLPLLVLLLVLFGTSLAWKASRLANAPPASARFARQVVPAPPPSSVRHRRQADQTEPTGPIKSYQQFTNLTANEAERQELPAGYGDDDFAIFEKREIVDKHNELRRTPAARNDAERSASNAIKSSNMDHMDWDDDLAYMAVQWAGYCQFSHGQPENVSPYENLGQNLWAWTGTANQPKSGVTATQDWYDEVVDYYYDTGYCTGVCGHYTQVVWGSTNKVGCGRAFCPYLGSAGLRNAWYVVCNYAPAGNWQGQTPYLIGTPCRECSSGVGQCYNDLCRLCSTHSEPCVCKQTCQNCGRLDRASCTCNCPNGYYGSDCSKQCVDTSTRCYNTWWPEFCADYPQVREGCPQMCQLCTARDPNFVCNPDTVNPGVPTIAPPVVPGATPAVCNQKFTAVTYVNGRLYLFRDDKVWRVRTNKQLLSPPEGELATDYFRSLPNKVTGAYELSNGDVVFIRGKKMFIHTGPRRTGRETLSRLGLPKALTGAIHVSWEGKTYFFKGSNVYRYTESTKQLDSGYPRSIASEFPGVPDKISAAFSDTSGNKYFIRSKKFFKMSYGNTQVDAGYPKHFTREFIDVCAQ